MIDQDKRKRKVPDWLFACVEAVTEVLIWWALGVLTNELRINIVTGVFSSSLHALIDWIAFATPAYVLMIVCQLLSNICIIKKTINAIHFKSYTHVLDNTI